ncbi:MAG: hypothetical protein KDB22_15095 [Planctomycetales bacterium]|nr:hypothetical protein [Planctomycetales bacterium]
MPIARDPRNERRRRILRDSLDDQSPAKNSAAQKRGNTSTDAADSANSRRGAGYSQDVRQVCGHRLVQLIPIRKRSYLAVLLISWLVPAALLALHYMIYVQGRWYGHPLALSLDANYPRSIVAWVTSQLWLLCLGTTVLTFQLRRHKLDDYRGDYRLWFWLVLTCLIGSFQSSTGIIGLFASALDPWSRLNVGWSGPMVVTATVSVLLGMLALRLCTELKNVPSSVAWMLLGLLGWATSAALAQPEFTIQLSAQHRAWLVASCWLYGLTFIWLSGLTYLRHVYIQAQHRFLLRGRLAASVNAIPVHQRIRESLPSLPSLPRFLRQTGELANEDSADNSESIKTTRSSRWSRRSKGEGDQEPQLKSRRGFASFLRRGPAAAESEIDAGSSTTTNQQTTQSSAEPQTPLSSRRQHASQQDTQPNSRPSKPTASVANSDQTKTKLSGRFSRWLKGAAKSDEADEYKKILRDRTSEASSRSKSASEADEVEPADTDRPRRSWLPKMPHLKMPRMPSSKLGGLTSRLRMPKLPSIKLPSLRLPPPEQDDGALGDPTSLKKVRQDRPIPNTNSPTTSSVGKNSAAYNQQTDSQDPESGDLSRPMTKAERKRLRRIQQQRDRAA